MKNMYKILGFIGYGLTLFFSMWLTNYDFIVNPEGLATITMINNLPSLAVALIGLFVSTILIGYGDEK